MTQRWRKTDSNSQSRVPTAAAFLIMKSLSAAASAPQTQKGFAQDSLPQR